MNTSKLTEQIMRRRLAATARVLGGLRGGPAAMAAAVRSTSTAVVRARTLATYRKATRHKAGD
jgi:hypothetical protein